MVLDFCIPTARPPRIRRRSSRPPASSPDSAAPVHLPHLLPRTRSSTTGSCRTRSPPPRAASAPSWCSRSRRAFGCGTPASGSRWSSRASASPPACPSTATTPSPTRTARRPSPTSPRAPATATSSSRRTWASLRATSPTRSRAASARSSSTPTSGPGGPPAGPLVLPFGGTLPATFAVAGSRLFLGDGVTGRYITGSPFNTNYFELCGPLPAPVLAADGVTVVTPGNPNYNCYRQEFFTVTGMLRDLTANPIGSPLSIQRATYNRDAPPPASTSWPAPLPAPARAPPSSPPAARTSRPSSWTARRPSATGTPRASPSPPASCRAPSP